VRPAIDAVSKKFALDALVAVTSSVARSRLEVRAERCRPRAHQEGTADLVAHIAPRSTCALTFGPDDRDKRGGSERELR
jgi:hypothetical protein